MQVRLLALLLDQPERDWTIQGLAHALDSPASSVHRELGRAEQAGIIVRNAAVRPHSFRAATESPFHRPLRELLQRSVGIEQQLRTALQRSNVLASVIHGSWASGKRRPDSDVDVLVIGEADLRDLRRAVRPIGKATGRTIDLVVLSVEELHRLRKDRSGFLQGVLDSHIKLTGDLNSIINQ